MSTKRLFVGNLPFSTTESDLLIHFGDFQPHSAKLIPDRGFGFVDIEGDQLDACVEAMNGSQLGGRTLRVNLVHISQIWEERVARVSGKIREGDVVRVKVLGVDRQGRVRLSMRNVYG